MRRIFYAGVLAVAVGALVWVMGPLLYPAGQGPGQPLQLSVDGMHPGEVRLVSGLWVARQPDGEFYVFLNQDPHGGHPTRWDPELGAFHSPTHGEIYSISGVCQGGPCGSSGPRGPGQLWRVAARVEGDRLVVYPDRILSGGISGSRPERAAPAALFHQ